MLKRILGIVLIFFCSTAAWMILAASIWTRTNDSGAKLSAGVASTWGAPQVQLQPFAIFEGADTSHLHAERTRVKADLGLEYRQKGLLWYSTYVVEFAGAYSFRNPGGQPRRMEFLLPFPARQAIYDDLTVAANGVPLSSISDQNGVSAWADVPAGQAVDFRVNYKSHGLDSWRYNFGKDLTQTGDFALTLNTNFKNIDFPANTLSPNEKVETAAGWELNWHYRNLISGCEIGMTMPEKLQPGPIAGEISAFAPVSLLLFFFVMVVLTTVRKVELHPMNYFFLAAAFFAFHLLLAYSVDHVSIEWAFAISSVVSVALVVSYLRLVVGPRFAVWEAGAAQFVYLVLFSATFFLRGFTGLAITIGYIVTLYVAMQVTARVQWRERFARGVPVGEVLRRSDCSWLS